MKQKNKNLLPCIAWAGQDRAWSVVGQIMLIFPLVFFSSSLISRERSIEDIQLSHDKVVTTFTGLQKEDKVADRQALQQLFKVAHAAESDYLKQLLRDIAQLKKVIKKKRKNKENVDAEKQIMDSLTALHRFLKKYRLQIEIVGHHAQLRSGWGDMFDLVDKGQDILSALPSKGIQEPGIKGLKSLIRKMERLLGKIDEYEDRLHADWVDLKLTNYVFKIELIRLRNAAIFHPLYKGMPMKTNYPR